MASALPTLLSRGARVLHQYVLPKTLQRCSSFQLPSMCAAMSYRPVTTQVFFGPTHFSFGCVTLKTFFPSRLNNNVLLRTLELTPKSYMQARTVTMYSKNGKRKTVKAVAKRFIRTGSGKLKFWPAGKVHNMLAKSRKKRLKLRKAKYVSKTQLKMLNKMISGW